MYNFFLSEQIFKGPNLNFIIEVQACTHWICDTGSNMKFWYVYDNSPSPEIEGGNLRKQDTIINNPVIRIN